jgi:hypothetical protein
MTHPARFHTRAIRRAVGLSGALGTVVLLMSLAAPSIAAGAGNQPVDPSTLNPPPPPSYNPVCSDVGDHIACSITFSDPDIVDEPSGIVCDGTELLITQSRSVVGTRLYDADGNLLQRHFRETLNGTFTNPDTGLFAWWAQHDTVIHDLSVPGDSTSGSEHVSGAFTRAWLPSGGTIINDAGNAIFDEATGDVLKESGNHPFIAYFAFGDSAAIAPLCAALS